MIIFVAVPVYDGKLPVETARCLMDEMLIAKGIGDELQVRFLPNCSHPAMGRNQLAHDFMESGADRMVFVDADVTCAAGSIVKVAHFPVDFVGGAYRYKFDDENYPVGWIESDNLWSDELGLIEVKTLPGGFLSLSRKVFETLKAAHPDREYTHFDKTNHVYFTMPWQDGALYGEDSFFCKSWRDTGGKIYLDPDLALTHWEFNKPYCGHVGNWLKRLSGIQLSA